MSALLLAAAACSDGGGEQPTAQPSRPSATPQEAGGVDGSFVYRTGAFEPPTTDNLWALLGADDATSTDEYGLGATSCSLYEVSYPDVELVPALAAADPPVPMEAEGGAWVVNVPLRADLRWSDGEPLTAEDVAFTFETVRALSLGGGWAQDYPYGGSADDAGLVEVRADGRTTLRLVFDSRPGLASWPNRVGFGRVLPSHFWQPIVDRAKVAGNADVLLEASGRGAPSCGPVVLGEWDAASGVRLSANPHYHARGQERQFEADGGGSYGLGPHFEAEHITIYETMEAGVAALQDGRAHYLYSPHGMQPGLRERVAADPNLTVVANPGYQLRYLGFNLRRQPMADPAFRRAVATLIDRDFMANEVLQGGGTALHTVMSPSNRAWFDEDAAEALREPFVGFADQQARLEAAVAILEEAGYSWRTAPRVETGEDGARQFVGGEGLVMPDGTVVPALGLLSPGPGADPLRSTYAVWIANWATQLGIPLTVQPTSIEELTGRVFTQHPPAFDLYVFGWRLGRPTFLSGYRSWFASQGANNVVGYSNPDFDAAVRRYMATDDPVVAREIMWTELEPMIAEDLPYVVLFDVPIVEFYRSSSVEFPSITVLEGLQSQRGLKAAVRPSGS